MRAFQFQGRTALGCDSPGASLTGNHGTNGTVVRGYISGNAQVRQQQLTAREEGRMVTSVGKQKTETWGTCATVLSEGSGKISSKNIAVMVHCVP